MKVAGRWRYVYRAVDHCGQVIDVMISARRDAAPAARFFARARIHGDPEEITTDKAPALAHAVEATFPGARHDTEQYANNRIESDHARLKARLRPMRGLKRDRNAQEIVAGHAFVQNLRRGHYELGTYARPHLRLAAAFDELTRVLCDGPTAQASSAPRHQSTQQTRCGTVAQCGVN